MDALKERFLKNEFLTMSVLGALGRSKTYSKSPSKQDKSLFRNALRDKLREIGDKYRHETLLAPTKEILDSYKKKEIDWPEYEKLFNDLLKMRKAHALLSESELHRACLLCSEPTPDKCHRRLVAEYLKNRLDNIEINHL